MLADEPDEGKHRTGEDDLKDTIRVGTHDTDGSGMALRGPVELEVAVVDIRQFH